MAIKTVEIAGLGTVRLQKRRGTRNLRISITAQGDIRVSLPPWVPYKLAIEFAERKRDWILKHRVQHLALSDGQVIGKAHRVQFLSSSTASRPSSRVGPNIIRVTYPVHLPTTDKTVQETALRGAIKALRAEAQSLLPTRLQNMALKHDFTYTQVQIKYLRSKWGSCNHLREITLNSFLMTLPWELIDYVLLHELVHTKILRHGEPFWQEMNRQNPQTTKLRKQIRERRPSFSSLLT